MVDYDKSVGNSGTMRLRDNGSTVSFMVRVGWSGTYWASTGYSYSGAGGSGSGSFGYPGGSVWVTVKTITVSSSGNVSWTVNATGTSEFGGPHTQTVYISRATVPPAPITKTPTVNSGTSMTFDMDDNGTGGSAITNRYYQVSTSSTFSGASDVALASNGTVTRTDLQPDTIYYWRARVRNAVGYSAYGTTRSAKTYAVPDKPSISSIWDVTHTSMKITMVDGLAEFEVPITDRYYQISTASNFAGSSDIVMPASKQAAEMGLLPNTTYYWRVRTKNSVGYSVWSDTASFKTLPGCLVRVGGVWKQAVPYVKVAGVWTPAIPYVRKSGVWTKSNT